MTRLFTDGAEMGDASFWDVAACIATTTQKRSGSYCYSIGNDDGLKYIPSISEFFIRFALRINSVTNDFRFAWSLNGAPVGHLRVNNTSKCIDLYLGTSTYVVSGITPLSITTWYIIEMHVKIDASVGRFEVKVNGNPDINYTGNTGTGLINSIEMYRTTSNYAYHVDDLALNDTDNSDGKNDNSWCGDGRIVRIYPSGSGTTNNWLNSGSVSGSANYLYVNEIPPDGDSTYAYTSGSLAGVRDQYAMSSFSGTDKVITRIYAESRIRKTQAVETSTVKTGFQTSGSTPQVSGSKVINLDYNRVVGDDAVINPATGLVWTEDDINAIEYVIETG
jgi:hypothetical protein